MLKSHAGSRTRSGRGQWLVVALGICSALSLVSLAGACASGGGSKSEVVQTPSERIKNEKLTSRQRVQALQDLWDQGQADRAGTREQLKSIAWRASIDLNMRLKAMEILLSDKADVNQADTRQMFALMLPPEPSIEMNEFISDAIGANKWTEAAPALVRAWARPNGRLDTERAERRALMNLFPGEPVTRVLFRVFVTPPPKESEGTTRQRLEASRSAAWEILTRLDPDGSQRLAMLSDASLTAPSGNDDKLVNDLRAAVNELKVVPLTANQMTWLSELRRFDAPAPATGASGSDGKARREWWQQTASAVGGLNGEQVKGLAMRNLEALRAASVSNDPRLKATRAALLSELRGKLEPRKHTMRTGTQDNGQSWGSESLSDQAEKFTWGDLLTILVIDDQLRDSDTVSELWGHIQRDMKDTTTELGGLFELRGAGTYRPVLYPPRATARRGDDRYVAPEEMFASAPTALAHFHMHAQRINNRDYAGPGPGDNEFARDQGRACLVITPLGEKRFNVDYYQAGGMALDLGEFKAN
ncbi:MAG: hypothetical protein IBJ18_04255 [Phycisphaerales bacterium]|nr:hypothetical protein [Phycisphaerales bacterium]